MAHGLWFSPASSTTNTDRHDIAEILLKVALSIIHQIKSNIINTMPDYGITFRVFNAKLKEMEKI
jgi:hypothetical protein